MYEVRATNRKVNTILTVLIPHEHRSIVPLIVPQLQQVSKTLCVAKKPDMNHFDNIVALAIVLLSATVGASKAASCQTRSCKNLACTNAVYVHASDIACLLRFGLTSPPAAATAANARLKQLTPLHPNRCANPMWHTRHATFPYCTRYGCNVCHRAWAHPLKRRHRQHANMLIPHAACPTPRPHARPPLQPPLTACPLPPHGDTSFRMCAYSSRDRRLSALRSASAIMARAWAAVTFMCCGGGQGAGKGGGVHVPAYTAREAGSRVDSRVGIRSKVLVCPRVRPRVVGELEGVAAGPAAPCRGHPGMSSTARTQCSYKRGPPSLCHAAACLLDRHI